jgi:hypothetical protein
VRARVACALLLWLPLAARAAADLDQLVVLAVSPSDGRAVVREGGGAPAVKQVGDELLDGRYEIRALLGDGISLEERPGPPDPKSGHAALPAFDVHVYVVGPDGRSRVQRFEHLPATPATRKRGLVPLDARDKKLNTTTALEPAATPPAKPAPKAPPRAPTPP